MSTPETPDQPAPAADAAPALQSHEDEARMVLDELKQAVKAGHVKALELATLRAVKANDINIASEMKAFARLFAAAASRYPHPGVFVTAMGLMIVEELVLLRAQQTSAGQA
jgi:hypothetical protein